MAQKPSPKPSPKPAAAKPAPAKKPGGGNRRRTLLLVGIGALALLIGLGVAWFFLVRPSGSGEGGPLRIVKDFLPTGKGDAGKGAKPTGPVLEGTHTVKAGENLWSIAKQGDLVTNPWEWRTILVQNKDKISYAFISEEDGAWKVMVEEGKVLKVKAPGYQADGVSGKQYAVQVLTVPDTRLRYATEVVKTLLSDGQYAYLYRRDFGGKSWYRIRAGFYPTQDEAKKAGDAILAKYADKKLFKEYWVTLPSSRERRGELIDYGAQRVKPWVVELAERDTQPKALEDLRALSPESEFAYISQRKIQGSGQYAYRTRVGFFDSEASAQAFISAKKDTVAALATAKPVKVDSFEEGLPGQNLKLGKAEPGEPYTDPPIDPNKPAEKAAPAGKQPAAEKKSAAKPAAAEKKTAAPEKKAAAPAAPAAKSNSGDAPFEKSAAPK